MKGAAFQREDEVQRKVKCKKVKILTCEVWEAWKDCGGRVGCVFVFVFCSLLEVPVIHSQGFVVGGYSLSRRVSGQEGMVVCDSGDKDGIGMG